VHGLLIAGTGNKVEDFGVDSISQNMVGGVDVFHCRFAKKRRFTPLEISYVLPSIMKEGRATDFIPSVLTKTR
jgi:hypothetical protein